jgi:hypothetical protein
MQTQCNAEQYEFSCIERRRVMASFDGGRITSDAGALLLKRTDDAIGLIDRLAHCFIDGRRADLIEHSVRTLLGQRLFALALGYEDLNDHDELRKDPLFGVLLGKLEARRSDCEALAGKSTLNRLELFSKAGFSITTATCRCTSSAASSCCARSCGQRTSMARPGRWRSWSGSSDRFANAGHTRGSFCGPTRALPARR